MINASLPRRANFASGKNFIIWAAIIAAVTLAVGLAQTGIGHSLLRRAGLYEAPTSYTSLAFADPQSLPMHLSSAPTKVKMSFALSNTSTGLRSYHWSIMLERARRNYRLAAGEVSVPAGENMTVARTVTASCASGRALMMVQVATPAESIDFWVTCSPQKNGKR